MNGADLRQLRIDAHLSMREAGLLINVSLATINRWEHGQLGNPALVAVYCHKLKGIIKAQTPITV